MTPHPSTVLPPSLTLASFALAHPKPERLRALLVALGEDDVPVAWGSAPALCVERRR